jgi:hypothetical protein
MALALVDAVRTSLADALGDTIDFGSTETGGKLVIETTGDVEVSLHRFSSPFDTGAATGTITMDGAPKDDTTAAGGTAAQFSLFNRNNVKLMEGVVATTGEDLDLSSLVVGIGDTVSLTAFSLTVPV